MTRTIGCILNKNSEDVMNYTGQYAIFPFVEFNKVDKKNNSNIQQNWNLEPKQQFSQNKTIKSFQYNTKKRNLT